MRKQENKIVRTPRPAYTLFELMLILVLLILLAAIAYPSLDSLLGTFRMNAAADMLRASWADARASAMNEGRAYRFAVLPNLVVDDALPKGVRFATPDSYQSAALYQTGESSLPVGSVDSNSWSTIVTFLPDGTTKEDVEIVFTGSGARPLDIKLRALTGAVTVRALKQ